MGWGQPRLMRWIWDENCPSPPGYKWATNRLQRQLMLLTYANYLQMKSHYSGADISTLATCQASHSFKLLLTYKWFQWACLSLYVYRDTWSVFHMRNIRVYILGVMHCWGDSSLLGLLTQRQMFEHLQAQQILWLVCHITDICRMLWYVHGQSKAWLKLSWIPMVNLSNIRHYGDFVFTDMALMIFGH